MEEKQEPAFTERASQAKLKTRALSLTLALLMILVLAGIYRWITRPKSSLLRDLLSQINTSSIYAGNPYQLAVQKVEEDRGEETGNKAKVAVPAQLKLYKDRSRFLAIQVAEWLEQKYPIPDDFAELALMINRGEFGELPPLGSSYILYGVGIKANDELTHYDRKTGRSIPLFSGEPELDKEVERLNDSLKEMETRTRALRDELAQVAKQDRARKKELTKQIAETRKESDATVKRRELINSFYKDKENRQLMTNEYEALAQLARNFGGQSFDLNDANARKQFKIKLLSMVRTAARTQMEEIAAAYQQKFDRPLPLTSLIRTREYQRFLGESGNPNATGIDIAPHTTGLAFDIYTYYMNAEEQQFLMGEIVRLEREGRLEALRENRHHIHVFAFADGKAPAESLIKESLRKTASSADLDEE